ncbi:hypothetical protein [Psychroserpens luteolus]|uniref:hypothetical protein n=1 Tax=Psychroserpens luteolus TaxID=2855840 RepID=UPI001E49BB3D|nr:hypothetical protein [Psychroserpens luteolus]MCD2259215.1 hypothetical protein [Psychroserpens luteolus]
MKRLLPLLLVLSLFTLSACEDFLDCIINRRPELPNKSFGVGELETYYYEEFKAEIKNEPRDDDYGYFFEIDGELPEGLEMFVNYRTVSIEGLPTNPGTYRFTVLLFVDPPVSYDYETDQYDDPLCSESTSKEYMISINP